jgi:ATP-binding cassette subfamily F protein 3
MIRVENLTKSFGELILFDGLGFSVNQKQRVGLVGQNGHGKTTLFRMIAGEERPDSGSIIIPKNYRIDYVRQNLKFTADTALNEGIRALPEQEKDHHWKVEKILAGLGFSRQDFDRHPDDLSGGLQVRLNLVKALVAEPDLLLLDEPTNFLDITSIRWVEQFLSSWPHELMLITHDRSFMDKVVTHTMGIHRRKLPEIPPSTTAKSPRTRKSTKKPESTTNAVVKKFSSLSLVFGPRQGWQIWCNPASRPLKKWKKRINSKS